MRNTSVFFLQSLNHPSTDYYLICGYFIQNPEDARHMWNILNCLLFHLIQTKQTMLISFRVLNQRLNCDYVNIGWNHLWKMTHSMHILLHHFGSSVWIFHSESETFADWVSHNVRCSIQMISHSHQDWIQKLSTSSVTCPWTETTNNACYECLLWLAFPGDGRKLCNGVVSSSHSSNGVSEYHSINKCP